MKINLDKIQNILQTYTQNKSSIVIDDGKFKWEHNGIDLTIQEIVENTDRIYFYFGTHHQANFYAQRLGVSRKQMVYIIGGLETMCGTYQPCVFYGGTHYLRKDTSDFWHIMDSRKALTYHISEDMVL